MMHDFDAQDQEDERIIATAVLAGWVIEERHGDQGVVFYLFDMYGHCHGFNHSRANAAKYALGTMEKEQ